MDKDEESIWHSATLYELSEAHKDLAFQVADGAARSSDGEAILNRLIELGLARLNDRGYVEIAPISHETLEDVAEQVLGSSDADARWTS